MDRITKNRLYRTISPSAKRLKERLPLAWCWIGAESDESRFRDSITLRVPKLTMMFTLKRQWSGKTAAQKTGKGAVRMSCNEDVRALLKMDSSGQRGAVAS